VPKVVVVTLLSHFTAFLQRTAHEFLVRLAEFVPTTNGNGVVTDYDFAASDQKQTIHAEYNRRFGRSLPDDFAEHLDRWFDDLEAGRDCLVYLSSNLGEGYLTINVAQLRDRMPPADMREFSLFLVLRVITTGLLDFGGRTLRVQVATWKKEPPSRRKKTYVSATSAPRLPLPVSRRRVLTKEEAQAAFDDAVTKLEVIPKTDKGFHLLLDGLGIARRRLRELRRNCLDERLHITGRPTEKSDAKSPSKMSRTPQK
jgi:hypothetical protein